MQKIMTCFSDSAKEMKKVKTLVVTAMLIALYLVLESFSFAITPFLPNYLRISLSFIAIGLIGCLFGPSVAAVAGAVTDILACFLFPRGAWFPGFTLTAMVGGILFGLGLYRKQLTFPRVLWTRGCIDLICNIGLNTIWTSIVANKAISVILWSRVIKNMIAWPIEALLFFAVAGTVVAVYRRTRSGRA